jgi:hypothetical protein
VPRQQEARKAAKKARRRKRQAAQQAAWTPADDSADPTADAIGEAVADIDDWITARGWLLDADTAEDLVSWVYPPSAATFEDADREPVTRVWITVEEDDDEVALEFGAAPVGAGPGDTVYTLDPDRLADNLAALEAYRPGSPPPELA